MLLLLLLLLQASYAQKFALPIHPKEQQSLAVILAAVVPKLLYGKKTVVLCASAWIEK